MNLLISDLTREELAELMKQTKKWGTKRLVIGGDLQLDIHAKLDKILRACCSHTHRVAGTAPGSPIVCEDCKQQVGTVPRTR